MIQEECGVKVMPSIFFWSYLMTSIDSGVGAGPSSSLQVETTAPSSTPSPLENNPGGGDPSPTFVSHDSSPRGGRTPPSPPFASISAQDPPLTFVRLDYSSKCRKDPSPTSVCLDFGPGPSSHLFSPRLQLQAQEGPLSHLHLPRFQPRTLLCLHLPQLQLQAQEGPLSHLCLPRFRPR